MPCLYMAGKRQEKLFLSPVSLLFGTFKKKENKILCLDLWSHKDLSA